MSNLHQRPRVSEKRSRQFRVNPPDPKERDSQARFTAKINQQFSLVSDELAKIPKFPRGYSIEDYARKDEVEEIIDKLDEQAFDLVSSEGDEEVDVGAGRRAAQARSSRRRHRAAQQAEAAANAALESARPLAAPPEVEDMGAIGTANTPPRFSYEDHTHSGVNLGDPQTITGLKTFDRDPAAPFAVTAGSAVVTNLDADFLDGFSESAFALLAGRSGGQTLIGGTAASEDLILVSTSNATKDRVFIGTSIAFDELNQRIGIGTNALAPLAALHAVESTTGEEIFRFESLTATDDPNYYAKQYRVLTTDATATTLATIPITASKTYLLDARVDARRTGGAAGTADDGAVYIRRSMVTTKGGVVTINAVQDGLTQEDQAAWDATFIVSGTDVILQVTGAIDNDVTWHATVRLQDVGT